MANKDHPHDQHRARMRQRYYNAYLTGHPLEGFAEHEILELLLFYAIPRRNTNDLAHALIDQFGSLEGVLNAHLDDLAKVPGIGRNSAMLLSLLKPLCTYCSIGSTQEKRSLRNVEETGKLCVELLRGKKNECLYLICLDSNFRVLHICPLQQGSVSSLPIYPRQVIEICLRYNASHVILAHNHPGGHPQPSHSDIAMTKQLLSVLKPLEITLVDHIIVADDAYYSFISHINLQDETLIERKKQLMAAEENNLVID